MSYACHGLFFREGMVLAEDVTRNLPLGEDPLEAGKQVIVERGWAEDVLFTETGARVRGSIEAMQGSDREACKRRRGVLSELIEEKTKNEGRVAEVKEEDSGRRERREEGRQ